MSEPAYEALALAVSNQLSALAHLQFKFEVQQMMLFGGRGAWIDETTRDLESAIQGVQRADVVFRRALVEATHKIGLSPESTLREVALSLGEPWGYIFTQGREDLRRAVARVDELSMENRKLLTRGYLATKEALAMLGVNTDTSYDANGAAVSAPSSIILNVQA